MVEINYREGDEESTSPDDQLAYQLALWHVHGIGPKLFYALCLAFPDLADLFRTPYDELIQLGLNEQIAKQIRSPNWNAVTTHLSWAEHCEHHIITVYSAAYPPLLREIHYPPPLLFVWGNCEVLKNTQIAMVGSRKPTPSGKEIAFRFATELIECGYTITSGLAIGIDADSHRGAIAANGHTIAVLGTGLQAIYPHRHLHLAEEIANNGAVVSSFSLTTKPLPAHFPRRNRIISGLSVGTLVVEAALKSGSLITARNAMEQNREVFAVPGSINNPMSQGCHYLLRQGAKIVTQVADITEELTPFLSPCLQQKLCAQTIASHKTLEKDQQNLVKCLGYEPNCIDTLVTRTGYSAKRVSSLLLSLELKGFVASVPGGYCLLHHVKK